MKNPLKYLKHIVKDPIKNIAEADARKKEIMPLFYVSLGVLGLGLVLQLAAKLDFMSALSFFGLVGVAFCGFLFWVIKKAKERFEGLTCYKCGALAEIKTREDFVKYISFAVESDEAIFNGYSGNKEPSNGIYSLVKYSGSSKAVLSVVLTCPHCGEIKRLRYCAEPFKCHAEATKVGALRFKEVASSLEMAVRTAVNDYNREKESIPYSIHSSKNSHFEERTTLKGANAPGAHPDYMGARIDFHQDVEEMLEHYFVLNQINGTLSDPYATSTKNAKPKNTVPTSAQNDSNTPAEQPVESAVEVSQKDKPAVCETKSTNGNEPIAVAVPTSKESVEKAAEFVPKKKAAQKSEDKKSNKTAVIIVSVCFVVIVGAVIGISLANRNKGEGGDGASSTPESEAESTTETAEEININDFVGYWYIKGNQEKELTIHSGDGDCVNISLWHAGESKINNVSAQLKDNVATFSLAVEGAVIKGTLTFQKDEITFNIAQSTLEAIPVEELKFTELYMSSSIPNKEETNNDITTEEETTVPSDTTGAAEEDAKPPMKETPYKFAAAGDTYGIYKSPSYGSACVSMLPKGTYTIVEEKYDENNNLWGKLKSGAGWICVAENTGE